MNRQKMMAMKKFSDSIRKINNHKSGEKLATTFTASDDYVNICDKKGDYTDSASEFHRKIALESDDMLESGYSILHELLRMRASVELLDNENFMTFMKNCVHMIWKNFIHCYKSGHHILMQRVINKINSITRPDYIISCCRVSPNGPYDTHAPRNYTCFRGFGQYIEKSDIPVPRFYFYNTVSTSDDYTDVDANFYIWEAINNGTWRKMECLDQKYPNEERRSQNTDYATQKMRFYKSKLNKYMRLQNF